MKQETFDEMYDKIQRIFERNIRPDAKAACYIEVQNIPDKAAPYIVEKIIARDDYPRNLIKEIFNSYYAYKNAHPRSANERYDTSCPECDEGGRIYCWKKDQFGYWDSSIAYCEKCNPNDPSKTSKDAIEKSGYCVRRRGTVAEAEAWFREENIKHRCRLRNEPYLTPEQRRAEYEGRHPRIVERAVHHSAGREGQMLTMPGARKAGGKLPG